MLVTQIGSGTSASASSRFHVLLDVDARTSHPLWRSDRCAACGTCLLLCPRGAIAPADSGVVAISYGSCTGCGVCAAVCPARPPAIEMKLGSAPVGA
ncbi:MAG: 4Fe-4S binding protein [Planctomycetota bacterium]|jgi:2-oxoacid:acceptor oxidoreductase delta subunit (pyruvate/2-ketoisovalerate family)